MTNESAWFSRVQQLDLPAVLPISVLPGAQAPIQDWISIIREDPLLTIHLFRYANKMLASNDVSVHTLEHAVSLLGPERLTSLTTKVRRVEERSASSKGLLRAIGDSLLAASLLRQWFAIRQIPWTETDYWMALYYDLAIWLSWLLEPEKMESIEYRSRQGEDYTDLMQQMIGLPMREYNDMLCRFFQLPVAPRPNGDSAIVGETRTQPFKQSALRFFLPFSHELATAVRQNWQSATLDALCRKGEVSLGLTEFRPMLKQWVATAAREFTLSYAAVAAKSLLAQQPPLSLATGTHGFSDSDQQLAAKLSQAPATAEADLEDDPWPEAKAHAARPSLTKTDIRLPATSTTNAAPNRRYIDLNIQREIRRQFRHQRNWHSPVEIQKSALYGLQRGLNLSRIVVLEEVSGFWQTFDSEGCQTHPLLRNLKLPVISSHIIAQLSKRVTALWVNDSNRQQASKQLPPPLVAASNNESFFMRSFAIDNQVTMLLYADASLSDEPLNANDYKLFREYCADWNTALNKMRP